MLYGTLFLEPPNTINLGNKRVSPDAFPSREPLHGVSKNNFFKDREKFFSDPREVRRKGASAGVSLELDFPIAYKMSQKPAEALQPGAFILKLFLQYPDSSKADIKFSRKDIKTLFLLEQSEWDGFLVLLL